MMGQSQGNIIFLLCFTDRQCQVALVQNSQAALAHQRYRTPLSMPPGKQLCSVRSNHVMQAVHRRYARDGWTAAAAPAGKPTCAPPR